jgi:hypothetical protein
MEHEEKCQVCGEWTQTSLFSAGCVVVCESCSEMTGDYEEVEDETESIFLDKKCRGRQ